MSNRRRSSKAEVGWSPAIPPVTYLRLAEESFGRGAIHPDDEAMLASLKRGLEYERQFPGLLPDLLQSQNWSERVRTEGRKARIMLDANCNQAGTLQVGLSLLVHDPLSQTSISLAEDYDEWLLIGLSSDWSADWERPKRELTYFQYVGRFVRRLGDHDTAFHRYCLLAAIAEYERIRRVLAFDLDLIAAGEFRQAWDDGQLVGVEFLPLRSVLLERDRQGVT